MPPRCARSPTPSAPSSHRPILWICRPPSPPPPRLTFTPAGIAWFNLVWNDEVLWDMVDGFVASLVIVFVILAFNFRSMTWALVGYLPLLFTVALIYGTL